MNSGITLVDVRSEAMDTIRKLKEQKTSLKDAQAIKGLLDTVIDVAKTQVEFIKAMPNNIKEQLSTSEVKAIAGTLRDRDAELDQTFTEIEDRNKAPYEFGDNMDNIKLIVIDSFCGAGGVTEGFHRAKLNGKPCVAVVIGINHDEKAIQSHAANHPETKHFIEDFRTLNPEILLPIIEDAKRKYPRARVMFWMSAECTHHSKAKGGMSRDADSRSLPEYAYKYIEIINPDIIGVENVVEFIDWGPVKIKVITNKAGEELYCPLDIKRNKKTKAISINPVWVPIKERKGEFYKAWCEKIKSYGYHYGFDKLNAANYGAVTTRTRYFGFFSKEIKHIVFPEQTHSKDGKDGKKKWVAVKTCLDFSIEGESIFSRSKPLVEATLERIKSGLIRFVAGGKEAFMLKYNSMSQTKHYKAPGVDEPCPTISTQGRLQLVQAQFICKHFSGHPESKNKSIEEPAGSITCKDHHSLVNASFLSAYYGNGYNQSTECPCPTVTTNDRFALVDPEFLVSSYSGGGQLGSVKEPCPAIITNPKQRLVHCQFIDQQYGCSKATSIDQPIGTVTANPKFNVVQCKWVMNTNFNNIGNSLEQPAPTITANHKYHYLMNPQFDSKGRSIEAPCFTLIARMDKQPPYLITSEQDTSKLPSFIRIEGNNLIYEIYDTDTPKMKEIKEFMALYWITDIKMRMLLELELLRIMGFGDNYILVGSQTDKKRFIGNAVECKQSKAIGESIARTI